MHIDLLNRPCSYINNSLKQYIPHLPDTTVLEITNFFLTTVFGRIAYEGLPKLLFSIARAPDLKPRDLGRLFKPLVKSSFYTGAQMALIPLCRAAVLVAYRYFKQFLGYPATDRQNPNYTYALEESFSWGIAAATATYIGIKKLPALSARHIVPISAVMFFGWLCITIDILWDIHTEQSTRATLSISAPHPRPLPDAPGTG